MVRTSRPYQLVRAPSVTRYGLHLRPSLAGFGRGTFFPRRPRLANRPFRTPAHGRGRPTGAVSTPVAPGDYAPRCNTVITFRKNLNGIKSLGVTVYLHEHLNSQAAHAGIFDANRAGRGSSSPSPVSFHIVFTRFFDRAGPAIWQLLPTVSIYGPGQKALILRLIFDLLARSREWPFGMGVVSGLRRCRTSCTNWSVFSDIGRAGDRAVVRATKCCPALFFLEAGLPGRD